MCFAADSGAYAVPPPLRAALGRWIRDAELPGEFLFAVLANDLRETIGTAGPAELQLLPAIILHLVNNAPPQCWGSRNDVAEWLHSRGLNGRQKIMQEAKIS